MFSSVALQWKVVAVIAVISISAVALVGVFARQTTLDEFDRLRRQQSLSDFIEYSSEYFQNNGSWQGIAQVLSNEFVPNNTPPSEPPARGNRNPPPASQENRNNNQGNPQEPRRQPPRLPFLLVGTNGRALLRAERFDRGDWVDRRLLDESIPIQVNDAIIGYVVDRSDPSPPLDPEEQAYLDRTNRAIISAMIVTSGLTLVGGILVARMLTRPLHTLRNAILAMDKGQLKQEVRIQSKDEIGELANAFNQMSANVAQANQLREQMTADIAHDLRTPLTVLRGYLESMQDGTLQPSPERFDFMYTEVLFLQRLVEDLRLLSLVDAGELTINYTKITSADLLQRVYHQFSALTEQENIELTVAVDPDLPPLEIDPDRMQQVLANLVSNAIRYTPSGGKITLTARQDADSIQIGVQDTGAGIPPEILPNIFERFVRAESSRQAAQGETGLGLAIAQSIVEAHGGEITVISEREAGTTFMIALPLSARAA